MTGILDNNNFGNSSVSLGISNTDCMQLLQYFLVECLRFIKNSQKS